MNSTHPILKRATVTTLFAAIVFFAGWLNAVAYPLDGAEISGIQRLIGYMNAQLRPTGAKLPPGALLGIDEIHLQLHDAGPMPDFDQSPPDPILQSLLEKMLQQRDPSYGTVVIDTSNPEHIAWAAVRPDVTQNPGSVGKLLVMIGFFDALARAFPDTEKRREILRETKVLAGDWVITDHHDIPHYNPDTGFNSFSRPKESDVFTLAEWIDHMISPSANAAASVVWREAMLLDRFGEQYPPSADETREFFKTTPRLELTVLSQSVINDPLAKAEINLEDVQQGSFFTSMGKRHIPGIVSYSTPRELARILFRMEQGRLVDAWSSLEMKRYLYMTKRRYRYVYAPELKQAAVYFKSGSLYQCRPEENYTCGQYMGNKNNYMNSVAIIEWPQEGDKKISYIASLMSNVLKVNSAWEHSRIAVAIDNIVRARTATEIKDQGDKLEIQNSGKS